MPGREIGAAWQALEKALAATDTALWAMLTAPEDDEPETEEERTAVAEAYEALARGEVVSDADLARELGL